ncbi:PadR family transcriptional regulator [Bremerella cremea]|uniref:PadR family transcriptional regulator n=1 Tax=Blastopirellula marina TaxID=124 RepID=A0A2S8G830_9BACT|nr:MULTISPECIES: PadR family transcriptional regulator [Pirellulaceae]PQO40606.1 PadR family transcriptional regulator [Blastopirellula marina]RCS52188.1 PadR family transcriptional regulator [Bremerella cremea]
MAEDEPSRKFQKELNAGAVSLILLSILEQHGEPMYGYEIGKWLETHAGKPLPMNQGALYPVLRSLEKQGLLHSQTLPSESGPPRKYYQITTVGKQTLVTWTDAWHKNTRFVNSVLELRDAKDSGSRSDSLSGRARNKP